MVENTPPPAHELAAFFPREDIESPLEVQTKLREYTKLTETQGFEGMMADITQDGKYQSFKSSISPFMKKVKLKEYTLSDQAYAVAEINRIVWEALKPNLIFRELVTIWHTTHPSFRFIRAILAPRAFDVQEGTEIPVAGEKYDYIDATMRKIGIRPTISREAIEDMTWDVVGRQAAEGGRAMAQKENELGLAILNTAGSSGNNYQGYGQSYDPATANTLAYADIANGIGLIRAQNAFPDTLAVHPTDEALLLQDDKFIHTFYFGGLMKKALGPPEFFGQMLGFRTLTSTLLTNIATSGGNALLLDSARAAGFVIRRDVTVENLIDPIKDLTGMSYTARINLAVLRQMAICAITETGT